MLVFGSVLLTFRCCADLCHTLCNADDDDVQTSADDCETGSIGSDDVDPNYHSTDQIFSIYKPMLISRELSPANCDIKLNVKEEMRVITCYDKINCKLLKDGYNLPAVVVDT